MKKRILLVDDEEVFTRLLKLNLEQTGLYEVKVENWAGAAVATARDFRPDLVLLDVIMPQMFGGDIAAQLQADPLLKDIPIVFLSATLSKSRAAGDEGIIGGYPFLAKPATVEQVIHCIEKYISKNRENAQTEMDE